MSDDFIALVPADPRFAASSDAQNRVAAILKRLAPSSDSIEPEVSEAIRFHDAGANFEGKPKQQRAWRSAQPLGRTTARRPPLR
jgi:hypothetical protein